MQDDGKLASDRDLGLAQPASLCEPDAPGFERRPFCDAREYYVGCFVEVASQQLVATLRDTARPVDLAGRVSSSGQSDIGSNASRSLEANGVVDRREEAKSRDRANAGCCHEPSHLSIVARQLHHLTVEVRDLPLDRLACLQQRLDSGGKFRPILDQFCSAHGKHIHLCPPNDKPEVLEESTDLVLQIPLNFDEQSSADEKSFARVTVETFDADLLVPSTLHDACDTDGIVAVVLVDLHLKGGLCGPGIDTDDGQPYLVEFGP